MKCGTVIAERFEVVELAGTGGMGSVYRARDRLTGADVALKTLRDDASEHGPRFSREATVLAELSHPAIVRYVAHGKVANGDAWLAMDWLEGESLSARLRRVNLGVAESLALVGRVAEALGVAHARGIVHRDLKPSNLLLVDGDLGRVTVLDFGIARFSGRGADLTMAGAILGTPGYMAPEQARSDPGVDARADVFALGSLLFKCLTGREPFVGDDGVAVLVRVLLEEAPRLRQLRPDIPRALDDLMAEMLAKAPAERPRDGAAVARRIATLGDVDGAAPERVSVSPPALTNTERRVMCVVLSRIHEAFRVSEDTVPVRTHQAGEALERAVSEAVARLGATAEILADGSILVTLGGSGAATDLAARAVRCALALRALLPDAPVAVATGLGETSLQFPVGEVADRAASALRETTKGPPRSGSGMLPISLDAVTAGLLHDGFVVAEGPSGHELRGERERVTPARTLLGRPSACVGRDREIQALEGFFEECVSESVARCVLVTAPAGVGKSRLRYELLRKLRATGEPMSVWVGRGDPMSEGAPFGMLASALRQALGLLEGEPPPVRAQKLHARVSRSFAGADLERVVGFLGELVGVVSSAPTLEVRAARQDPMAMGDQMRRAFCDFVAAEAAARPILLVLEDLHWGDLPTVRFVDAALLANHDRPWMVLALARPEVAEVFPGLWRERGVNELPLAGLSRRAAERLVRETLGADLPPERVADLVDRAAGNAFYLEELIRAVADGRGDALPETVLAMVQARLEQVDGEARRLLRAASVFGQVFWRDGLLALLGGTKRAPRLDTCLEGLVHAELVTARGDGKFQGEREYVFRHAIVRDAAYAMLTDGDRALGHRLAAEWLEEAGESQSLVLAEHFERGLEPERAVAWYLHAAEQALEGNDFAAAQARAARGVAVGATGEVLGTLLLVQADASMWRADQAESERCAMEAARHLPPGSDLWCAAMAASVRASCRLGHTDALLSAADALCAMADAGTSGPPFAIALSSAGVQLIYSGQAEPAARLMAILQRAEEVLTRDATVAHAWIRRVRGYRALHDGDIATYLRLSDEATQMFERAGDARTSCSLAVAVGYAELSLGLHARSELHLRAVLARARAIPLPTVVTLAKHNLGLALARQGVLAEALALEAEAVAESLAQGDRRIQSGARIYHALILMLAGELDRAEEEARASFDASTPPGQAYALAVLAAIRLRQGRDAEALGEARRARELLDEIGGIEEGEALVRLVHAEALHAAGEVEPAGVAIGLARDRLLERASRIGEASWRATFLEAVPENARTLALATEWIGRGAR